MIAGAYKASGNPVAPLWFQQSSWDCSLHANLKALGSHARLSEFGGGGALGMIRVEPGGRLGRHPARLRQALFVIAGSGYASGGVGDSQAVRAGDLVLLEANEDHETVASEALLLFVLEADRLTVPGLD